jgi:hypothetical protein
MMVWSLSSDTRPDTLVQDRTLQPRFLLHRTAGPYIWGNAMPTSQQAYWHTRLEGLFDHANLLRRGPAPTTLNRREISTRSVELVIDTVVCLTLA